MRRFGRPVQIQSNIGTHEDYSACYSTIGLEVLYPPRVIRMSWKIEIADEVTYTYFDTSVLQVLR